MQSRVRKVRRAMIEGGIGMSRFIGVRVAGCALALLVSVGLAGATFAQTSLPQTPQMPPARTFKVIYPFVAGASGDVLTRLVVDRISAGLSVATIVENRTGAAGRLGAKAVAAAEPDGLTLLVASSPLIVIYPHSHAALDYDPENDLVPRRASSAIVLRRRSSRRARLAALGA